MFKKKTLMLILALLIIGIAASVAQAAPAVILDGQQLSFDVAPVIDNGRTLVPLRAIFESLGANVEWDSASSTVTATRGDTNIRLQIGNTTAYKNGVGVTLDVPGQLVQNRTMVPLRFVGEALGCSVNWNASSFAVEITSTGTRELSTEGLIQAFKDAGLSVIDEVIYTSSTDPNKLLGRPGEYIAKINFNDSNFSETGDTPELTIEQFSNKEDMEKRRDYIQTITDSSSLNAFKYYIYDNNVFLFRIPYDVTPEKAAEYASVFNAYMNYVDITPIPPTNVDITPIPPKNVDIKPIPPTNVDIAKSNTISLAGVKSATELESYLKDNFGELKTEFKTFNLKNYIRVIENEDQFKCFDIAIVIDWDAFVGEGYYDIRNSIKYTKEQKKAFEDSINTYQKSIADAAISAMPTKKIRGGFLDYGYEYPNLKKDYYEGAPFGWKNYAYSTSIFPYYEDTKITEFHWHSFNGISDPFDQIGLY